MKMSDVLTLLSTTRLLTSFLIGSYHEMFTCVANYDMALKMLHHKLVHETIFSYTISEWFNKQHTIPSDQLADSSHGIPFDQFTDSSHGVKDVFCDTQPNLTIVTALMLCRRSCAVSTK